MVLIGLVAFIMAGIPVAIAFALVMIPEAERRRALISERDCRYELAIASQVRSGRSCANGHVLESTGRFCETCGMSTSLGA